MVAKKQAQTPRPKHVPQRTCIACRRAETKRGLMRLVRDSEGRVTYDPTGKRAGRGAYLCHDVACWEQALKRQGLARALRLEALQTDDQHMLQQIAQRLVAEQSASEQLPTGE